MKIKKDLTEQRSSLSYEKGGNGSCTLNTKIQTHCQHNLSVVFAPNMLHNAKRISFQRAINLL